MTETARALKRLPRTARAAIDRAVDNALERMIAGGYHSDPVVAALERSADRYLVSLFVAQRKQRHKRNRANARKGGRPQAVARELISLWVMTERRRFGGPDKRSWRQVCQAVAAAHGLSLSTVQRAATPKVRRAADRW